MGATRDAQARRVLQDSAGLERLDFFEQDGRIDDDAGGYLVIWADEDGGDAATWYIDSDGDGYGDPDTTTVQCEAPTGYGSDARDCDDDEYV